MALNLSNDFRIIKTVQASHHQGDIRYGNTRGIQCSCMSLLSISWTVIKLPSFWDIFDLDSILYRGDQLFKSLEKYRHLGVEDLPPQFFIENHPMNVEFLENRTGEITAGAYMISITDIVSRCQEKGNGALIIVNQYMLGLIWGNSCFYLFDSHSKNKHGQISISGTAVLLKFETLSFLENYIRSVYYINCPMTMYFQVQFLKITCSAYTISSIKNLQNNERQTARKRKMKRKYQDSPETKKEYQKSRYSKNCKSKLEYQKNKYNENSELRKEYERSQYWENPELKREYKKSQYKKNAKTRKDKTKKKISGKGVEKFCQQIKQGPYYICTECQRSLYKRSVKVFRQEKYTIMTEKCRSFVNSFDGKIYICETCHKYLLKGVIPCQSVSNKMALDPIPKELQDLHRLERILISKRILFKKIAIMHGKGEFSKIKGTICNVPIESKSICNILPRPADSNGLIVVKLKRDLKYRGHVYFEPVRPQAIYQALNYLKVHNNFYEDISIQEGLTGNEMLNFTEIGTDFEDPLISHEKTNPDEVEHSLKEDPLNAYRIASNETALVSEVPALIDDENIIIAPGQGKTPLSLLNDEFCEELAFPYLLPNGKFGYNVKRDIPITPVRYFNQRLLNYHQTFASDPDYIFFARSLYEQYLLRSSINVAMHKIKPGQLTAGTIKQNYRGTIERFVASDNAFSFMSQVKGTPAYWKQFLLDVLAMVKQLGIPTYFLTLSCADLRWEELPHIINKLNKLGLSEEELKNLGYQQRCKLLNNNPVLVARHFQYKVELFFKEIILDGPLGKTKYYALRIEFQERGSPHVHSFIWVFDAPNIQDEKRYISFVENTINVQLPDPQDQPELFELVKTYQIHAHSRTCWKYNKNECRFSYGRFFSSKTIISKPLEPHLSKDEKQEILIWRKMLLKKVKNYIDNFLNPEKVNIIDPRKDNFQEPPSIIEILNQLDILEDDYYKALSISKDDDFELHLKREPNSCFVNNYFDDGLKAWKANMDIQPVFNEYKAVTYMCSYFSKSEDQCSQAMKEAAREAFENNAGQYQTMKTIARAYLSKRECSVQEAVYHILPELKLRRVFPAVQFVNTNLPGERVKVLLSEKELNELPDDSPNIFKKSNIDRYIDRPNKLYLGGKYAALDDFCFAEFSAYYTLDSSKPNESGSDYQPDELQDNFVAVNHKENGFPEVIKLMKSKEKLRCRKVRKVLRYHVPNNILHPEKYAHHLLMLFYPFRNENELLAGTPPLYQNKFLEPGVQDIVNNNKIEFEPFGDLVEEAYLHYNEHLIGNQDPQGQIENDETEQADFNENHNEEIDPNRSTAFSNFMPNVWSDDEILQAINSLNSKQRDVFNVVHNWSKDYVKYNGNVKPIHIFLSGSGGTGKSHLVKTIYQAVTKTFQRICKDAEKPSVLLLGPTGISAVNIGGTTIHSALGIKPGAKMNGLSERAKAAIRNKLSEVKLIMIDEISMVSSDLWTDVDARLAEIFKTYDLPFAGLSMITIGDFLQLPPVKGRFIFSQSSSSMNQLLSLQLWHLFKYAELTEIVRQSDLMFQNLLNNVRIGEIDEQNENLLKSKFILESDKNYPNNALHMYAENEPTIFRNQMILDVLPGQLYTIKAIDKIPDDCSYSRNVIQDAQNQKQTNTGGLAKSLQLKIGVRVMLTVNIDIQDRLINGQVGEVAHISVTNSDIQKVYIKFSDSQIGAKVKSSCWFSRQNSCVRIEKCEAEFPIKKGTSYPTIKRTQFPLVLAYASTVHKVQGLSIEQGVVDFNLRKQRSFGSGQIYTALSRIKTFDTLYCTGEYKRISIKASTEALKEYERLKEHSIFSEIEKNIVSDETLTFLILNVRSLAKHARDVASDSRILNNDIVSFTETQIELSDSTAMITETLQSFNMNYNNNINKFSSLAYGCQHNVAIVNKFDISSISIVRFKKSTFAEKIFTMMLIY